MAGGPEHMNLHLPLLPGGAMPLAFGQTLLRVYIVQTCVKALVAKNERFRTLVKKKEDSTWEMKMADLVEVAQSEFGLADLVEVAQSELGLTRAPAEAETVIALRERIQWNCEIMQQAQDPRLVVAHERMKHAELLAEMQWRNLLTPEKITRPTMNLMTKEQSDSLLQIAATNPATSHPTNETTLEKWMRVDEVTDKETHRR